MTELQELVKIRKLLTWMVKQKLKEIRGSEYDETEVEV